VKARVLPLAVWLAVGAGGAWAQSAPIPGAEAVRLVQRAMADGGFAPAPMVAPVRPLPPCAHAPRVAPLAGDWAAAEFICDAPRPWRRVLRTGAVGAVVPAQGAAGDQGAPDVGQQAVVVLARPLARGARIGPDDLRIEPRARTDPAQHLQDAAFAEGRRLRVALGAGQALLERHLEPAFDVEPGQDIAIRLQARGMDIAMAATALDAGVTGDRVRVQPASGGAPIDAVVIAPGLVRVRPNMPRRTAVKRAKRRLPWSVLSRRTSRGCALPASRTPCASRASHRCARRPAPARSRPLRPERTA
jgi:flagella basal body P-ring formation protein FlgA